MAKKIFIVATALVASLIIFVSFNTSQRRTQLKMGTFVEITLNGPIWTDFDKIFKKAFQAMDEVENLADRYNENSKISIVNREAYKYPFEVDEELYNLIEESISISKNTEGAFDITVAPLVELWGFYRKKNSFPSKDSVKEALKTVGYDNIVLNREKKSIFLKNNSVEIDLSAIAKGYAVDKAADAIRQFGVTSAIINAGGDVYCIGKKNVFKNWNVGIRNPIDNKKIIKVIHLKNRAVATSGGYENFFVHESKEYSHLIDPRTGLPVEASRNATVVAKNCVQADALATALCILGKDKAEQLKEKYDVEVYIF